MKKTLTLNLKPENVEIIKKEKEIEINIFSELDIILNMNNNTLIKTKGQFHVLADGEISLLSKNGIHIDTLDSNLYLNSRNSNILKNEPESIKYRNDNKLIHNKTKLDAIKQKEFTLLLKDRVSLLEKKVKELE